MNNEEILKELVSSDDINISLNEIVYYDEAGQKINLALNEIAGSGKSARKTTQKELIRARGMWRQC